VKRGPSKGRSNEYFCLFRSQQRGIGPFCSIGFDVLPPFVCVFKKQARMDTTRARRDPARAHGARLDNAMQAEAGRLPQPENRGAII